MTTNNNKWNQRYIRLAREIASWSKDPGTKVGAVAVGAYGQILSTGYNGFPRTIADTPERLNNRETKLSLTIHAENNCILNAALSGVSLNGAALFVYGLPICSHCAINVIQAGIKRVGMEYPYKISTEWQDSWTKTKQLFDEAGIEHFTWRTDETRN